MPGLSLMYMERYNENGANPGALDAVVQEMEEVSNGIFTLITDDIHVVMYSFEDDTILLIPEGDKAYQVLWNEDHNHKREGD